MKEILRVTENASVQLKKIIEAAPNGTVGVLIDIDKSGCSGYSYKMDFASKNDVKNLEYIEHRDVKVYIDPKATIFLLGSEMDYSSDKISSRFVFNNPNAKNQCGCGESFSV